jgi:capsular polysaccharide biosynthesis protein
MRVGDHNGALMSQQPLNLRRSVQIVRRHKLLVFALTVVGLIVGVGYAVVNGTAYTSQALVVLIPDESSAPNPSSTSPPTTGGDVDTQVVIAVSNSVLTAALPNIQPPVSLTSLQSEVTAGKPAIGVISITAVAKSESAAESEANAVANAYVAYISAAHSPVGRVPAQVLQHASTATGASPASTYGMSSGGGLVAGFLIGAGAALVISRRDRRLRSLDDIAGALGVPVVAALPVEHPVDAAAWTKVLDGYDPPAVHAWRLRQVLQEIGVGGQAERDGAAGPASVAVLSATTDPDALALGPQLASFAASVRIPTVLVMGPQQDSNVTAALHTACVGWAGGSDRASHLRTITADGGELAVPGGARLVVLLLAVDAKEAQFPQAMPTSSTLVGVSSGGATAEQLARIATAAAADGRDIGGILVADPELADHTTGRTGPSSRSARRGRQLASAYPDWVPTKSRR